MKIESEQVILWQDQVLVKLTTVLRLLMSLKRLLRVYL